MAKVDWIAGEVAGNQASDHERAAAQTFARLLAERPGRRVHRRERWRTKYALSKAAKAEAMRASGDFLRNEPNRPCHLTVVTRFRRPSKQKALRSATLIRKRVGHLRKRVGHRLPEEKWRAVNAWRLARLDRDPLLPAPVSQGGELSSRVNLYESASPSNGHPRRCRSSCFGKTNPIFPIWNHRVSFCALHN